VTGTGFADHPGSVTIEKLPLSRSIVDVYERALSQDQGVTLPAGDRLAPMTTEPGPTHEQLIIAVVSVETYSEVRPLSP
jgi:hypothetical protein